MGTGMGMTDRKLDRNGNSSLEEILVSHANHILVLFFQHTSCFFIAILSDLTVLWLTREPGRLYFVARKTCIALIL